jgi:hypothetical protein
LIRPIYSCRFPKERGITRDGSTSGGGTGTTSSATSSSCPPSPSSRLILSTLRFCSTENGFVTLRDTGFPLNLLN